MGVDESKCCRAKSTTRRGTTSSSSSKRKRTHVDHTERNENDSDSSDAVVKSAKKAKPVVEITEPVPSTSATSLEIPSGDIVCTPDIMSMFSSPLPDEDTSEIAEVVKPVKSSKRRKIVLKAYAPKTTGTDGTVVSQPPLSLVETDRQVVTVPTPKAAPVFHIINGYTIDLNNAAKQDTFRLPNGKLIQVKKQPNLNAATKQTTTTRTTSTSKPTSSPAPVAQSQINTPHQIRFVRPPTVIPVVAPSQPSHPPPLNSFMMPNNGTTVNLNHMPQIRHIGYTPNHTPTQQQLHMQSVHLQQQQQLLSTLQMVPPNTVVQQHPGPVRQQHPGPVRQQHPGPLRQPTDHQPVPYLQPSPSAFQHLQQLQAMASGMQSTNPQQTQQTPQNQSSSLQQIGPNSTVRVS